MAARLVQILASPGGSIKSSSSGVLVVRVRTGGGLRIPEGQGMGPPGTDAGIYDSAETALQEAFARVKWPLVS